MEKVKVRPSIRSTLASNSNYVWLVKVQLTLMMEFNSLVRLLLVSPPTSLLSQLLDGLWGLNAQGVQFSSVGNITYELLGGLDYQLGGGMTAELGDLITGYGYFDNKDEIEIDYLIMGPGFTNKSESQLK